jgi:predicted Zn-dependent protease
MFPKAGEFEARAWASDQGQRAAESLTEARLRSAPGMGDAILDQVLPLDRETAAELPPGVVDKVLTSEAAIGLLHEIAGEPSK